MKRTLWLIPFLFCFIGMVSWAWADTLYVGAEQTYTTIQAAVTAANPAGGDVIMVEAGTYNECVTINKNLTLLSVSGAASTIIDGVAGSQLGTIHLTNGRDGVRIGSIGQGFTIKGIDGPMGIEKAAVYLDDAQYNITIEGNVIEARGDAGLMGEYNAINVGIVINGNTFSGKTFLGDNPAGVGFSAQYSLLNVPRQLVVFGGGTGTSNTSNFTFTNNIISGIAGGMSITNNSGQPISPTQQGNTLVTLDLVGTNIISGNTFSGHTTSTAEALRLRGAGDYTVENNIFNGTYAYNITNATTTASIGIARAAAAYANNTFTKAAIVLNSSENVKINSIPAYINLAISLSAASDIVLVSPGTYTEDVDVSKSIILRGTNAATTIIQGAWGGNSQSVIISTNNTTVEHFTITRTGNTVADWANSNLNSIGIQVQTGRTGCVIQNCIITGNRNAVYLNDTRDHIVRNNVIDFNRTGLQLVNNVNNVLVENNQITNNWTLGVLIYHQSAGQNASTGVRIINNNISGNWYSQIECKTVQNNLTISYDCTQNWLGAAVPTVVTALAGEPGYADLIPEAYGGTSVPPGGSAGLISGNESFKVLYDPWWANPGMTLVGSNAPVENVTRNLFYQDIQTAIDAALDNETLRVSAGTFDQTMNIVGKTGLTITGAGEALTIFKPSTVIPWNYFGHTTGRRAAIRIVDSNAVTISGITLDCDLIKNSGWHGVLVANTDDCVLQNSTFKNMYSDQTHYYDIMIYARAMDPFTPETKADLSILGCKLIDTGRIGIITHDNVHSVINGNEIYKTTRSFGYGIEIGSSSTSVITNNTIYGFDAPAVSDNSTSGGIYIENAYTSAITTATSKPIQISGNQVSNCQIGLTVGNQWNNYAGNVDINLQITNNNFVNNVDYGVLITDEDKANGSSVTAVLTGNVITSNLATPDAIGLLIYAIGDGDLNVSMINNVVSGYEYGLYVYDWGNPMGSSFVLYATGNSFSNAHYGVFTGIANWIPVRLDNPYFAGNTFQDNTIHLENGNNADLNMDAIIANNTFIGGAYKFDQIIYSSTADIVYVDADDNLIMDSETQTYSVKALSISDLRSFTAQVKIPKAYFAQPANFTIGPLFSAYPEGTFFMYPMIPDANFWIYNVTGAYLGGYDGIDGGEVVLFTFSANSLADVNNTPAGCMIELPYDMLQLRDDMDPYNSIACLATEGMNILIDCIEPEMEHINSLEYPSGYLLQVMSDGSGALVLPILELGFSDNYDLGYSMYLIQGVGLDAPTDILDFSLALLTIDGEEDGDLWELPAIVNTYQDGTYTVYFLVVDEAGNIRIYDWDFIKDATPPEPIVWDVTIPCRTTPKQENAIDLKWANPEGTVRNHIWVKSYASLPDATGYPEYAPASNYAVPVAPNPYSALPQNGWEQFILIAPPTMPYRLTGMERGYYYITIFAEDASGNISAAPINTYYRESISYWPGDVVGVPDGVLHTVNASDIAAMSPIWGLSEGHDDWLNIMDVGPTVDNGRRSRPTPDNVIDIEDLMIFAMNYNNTVYAFYTRDGEDDELQPIRIDMQYATSGDKLFVELYLGDNNDFVRGLNIPFHYGSDLRFESIVIGDVWPEGSMVLHKDKDRTFSFTGTVLGENGTIIGNGHIGTVIFAIDGFDTGIELRHMIARSVDNQVVEILNNPTDVTTPVDDPVNSIPVVSYLGNNYPNPFNPSTTILYGLNNSGIVRVSIYNSRGQLVRTLVNTSMPAGTHSVVWNGKDNGNRLVSSGIYFIRMETRDGIITKKALMLK